MYESNYYEGAEGFDKVKAGFTTVCKAVSRTLGASGNNFLIEEKLRPFHRFTNDGITIAHSIHFKDNALEIGANIAREVSKRANDRSGDGTTTALTIAPVIIDEGMKLLKDKSGIAIKRELDAILPEVEKAIDAQARPCITYEEIRNIAITSAESEELGTVVADIYHKIGKEGFVEIENSGNADTSWEEIKGVRFLGAKSYSRAFLDNKGEYEQENPIIFVTTQPIRDSVALKNILGIVGKAGRQDMVLIADEVDDRALKDIAGTNRAVGARMIVVKSPTIGKDAFFEDIVELTGATLLSAKTGVTLDRARLDNAGTCEKITITEHTTTVLGGKDLTDYIEHLKTTLDEDTPLLKERLGALSAKAAKLKIGAKSESELSYLRDKAEDCVNSTKLAMQGGYVAGGGVCLLNVSREMPDTLGGNILKIALKAPVKNIIRNGGYEIADKIPNEGKTIFIEGEDFKNNHGFDAKKGAIVDMFDAGIIDSAIVCKNSVRAAVGTVELMFSIYNGGVCTQVEPKQQFMMMPPQA